MTLLQLKYIVKIVECGSMNEASHELYVSQPALSSSVKELEKELGMRVFTRSSQGIALTVDGAEFLTYARQVLDQASLLEERYKNAKPRKQLCTVSTQHYMFAVEAFVEMINSIKSDEYEFTIRETRTHDIIDSVANMRSDLGIIYLSDFNKDVIGKLLREKHLEFHPLFRAPLHVFISRNNPLATKKLITMKDLKPFPFIQYEQGEDGSFYFAEEAVWPDYSPKQINVTDRATILNFIIGLNGYTVCTGIDNGDLNNEKIVTVPLDSDETMLVGWITNERAKLSTAAENYLEKLSLRRRSRLQADRLTATRVIHTPGFNCVGRRIGSRCDAPLSLPACFMPFDQAPYWARYASAAAAICGVTYGAPSAVSICWPASKISFTFAMANTGKPNSASTALTAEVSESLVFSIRSALQHQTHDLNISLGLKLRDDLTHRGARSHHIVDEQHLHTIGQLGADHHAAVAMYTFFSLRSKV